MNSKSPAVAKAGSMLCVEHGEYSDYTVTGFFIVLRDFEPLKLQEAYLRANPSEREEYSFNRDAFLANLLAQGLLLEISYGTLDLGAYGDPTSMSFTPIGGTE